MSEEPKGFVAFWTSLPGVLTGIGTLMTAGTGLYIALHQPPSPQVTPVPRIKQGSVVPGSDAPRTLVAHPRFTGPMGALEHGVSYSGGDLYDRPAGSAEQCVTLCANDDRCRAVTFIISQQRCWIKDRINDPQQSGDMISARKGG